MTETARHMRNVTTFVVFVALVAAVSLVTLVAVDVHYRGYQEVNWIAFVLFSVLLFLGETRPSLWMRFGEGGEVTPGWAFAYALLLLGSPTGAVVVMVMTSLYVDVRHHKGALKIIFNLSQITVALSLGGLILIWFGVHGRLTFTGPIPLTAGMGIVLGGVAVFVVNGLLTATVIGLHQGVGFLNTMRAGFALSMSADGALLAMAPIFVIAIEYSVVLMPLLGMTSFLVYQSARNALRREHEATHDPLTKLLNRRAFDARLDESLEELGDEGLTVFVMDLDRFKDINDRLGHQVGDRLLISFAERLERMIPVDAFASRLGGDEFAVVFPGMSDRAAVDALLQRLHPLLSGRHDIDGFPLTVAVSVGASVAPRHGTTAETLMAAADLAMYRAKRFERGVEVAGGGTEDDHDLGRINLLVDLAAAVGTPQIHVAYQPLVDVTVGTLASVEALVRWTHPIYGPIPPVDFIGIAEQTDLIAPITEAMFRMSMTEMLRLGDRMPDLSVNVAPRSLLERHFASHLIEMVQDIGFPADRLEIEITERAIATSSARSRLALDQLREAGIRISIDDFGTGYSSFLALRDLPADRLKIDRQFTSRLTESAADELIVTKVIELAHGLGLDVVAEGVESERVHRRLATLGCDVVQGFAISRPMSLDEFVTWMDARERGEVGVCPVPTDRTARVAVPIDVELEAVLL